MSGEVKISFVVPAYNEEKVLPETLAAIATEIANTPVSAEVVVVNNASTDATAEVARRFPGVVVVDEPQKGLVAARRAGFLNSHGELVANIDADTRIARGWLARVLAEFAADPKLVALSGPYIYYDTPAYVRALTRAFYGLGYGAYLLNRFVLKKGSMLQGGNFVVRRSALEAIGGFNPEFSFYGEDTDLARRLIAAGRVKFTFRLPAYSSGRRLLAEGVWRIGMRYALNYMWVTYFHKPFSGSWLDIRR